MKNLTTKAEAKKLIDACVHYAARRTSGIEVSMTDSREVTHRFANNRMTDHVTTGGVGLSLRVLHKGRQARVTTCDTSLRGLHKAIDRAIEISASMPLDKTMLALPKVTGRTQALRVPGRFDPRMNNLSTADREAAVKSIIKVANANHLNTAGIYEVTTEMWALGNSEGVFHYDRLSDVECSVTMTGHNSSGWAKRNGNFLNMVDPEAIAHIAADKALRSRSAKRVRAGNWTVILEPSAVLDLLTFVWDELTGTAHVDATSSFTYEIGEKKLGDNITIYDDVYHPLQSGFTFDDEGLTRTRVTLVDKGVIGKPAMGRRSAHKLGYAPTGHGVMQPCGYDDAACNLVVAGGNSSIEQMIANTDRGLLLTRVWYCRPVDPNTNTITGTTRDGTFLIENGKIKHAVQDMRFNVSMLDMLNNVEELGEPVYASGEEGFPAVVPAMKVRNFRFSAAV